MNQQTAQGLASLGRGPDSMLVHMAPGEVKSLQQLAMAHGGSLTINPETGLPEAGFLSSILPMVLGAGAMMIPGLQGIGAAGIAAGIGGLEALRTGSLKKGLMAGFGAYGGAGLGSALAGAGAQSLATAAVPTVDVGQAMAAGAGDATANLAANATIPTGVAGNFSNMGTGISNLTSGAGRTAFMQNIGGAKGLMQAGAMAAAPMMMQTTTQQPEIKTDKDMGQRYRFEAGAPSPTPPADVPGYENQGQNFGKEQRYFNPRYAPIDNEAARKLYGYAYGGPVEDMSNGNDMAAYMGQDKFAGGGSINLQGTFDIGGGQGGSQTNMAFEPAKQTQPFIGNNNAPSMAPAVMPQNQLRKVTPEPQVIPGGLQGILKGPMSQGMAFAEGGEVGGYTYDPVTRMYTKKAGEGATMISPTGGISGASVGDSYQPAAPNPDFDTPEKQAAFYANNPGMGALTRGLQTGLSFLPGGMAIRAAQEYMDPGFQQRQQGLTYGYAPLDFTPEPSGMTGPQGQTSSQSGVGNPGEGDGGGPASIDSGSGPSGGFNSGGGGGEGGGDGAAGGEARGGLSPDFRYRMAQGGLSALAMAQGGMFNLGSYSDGGRLLRGPGDGVSDSIPAMIGKKQPARLADGEFVVPARIVSELGNGSTEAGARKLYAMMDRIQKARKKTIGKGKVAANSRSAKYLPA